MLRECHKTFKQFFGEMYTVHTQRTDHTDVPSLICTLIRPFKALKISILPCKLQLVYFLDTMLPLLVSLYSS